MDLSIKMWIEVLITCMLIFGIMYIHYKYDALDFREYYTEYIFESLTSILILRTVDTIYEIFFIEEDRDDDEDESINAKMLKKDLIN